MDELAANGRFRQKPIGPSQPLSSVRVSNRTINPNKTRDSEESSWRRTIEDGNLRALLQKMHPSTRKEEEQSLKANSLESYPWDNESQCLPAISDRTVLSPEKHILPVPVFQVTELFDSFLEIQGTFHTTENVTSIQEGKFKLSHNCLAAFSIHLSRTSYQPDQLPARYKNSSSSFEFMIELSLEHTSSSSVCWEDSYRKPTAVWARINAYQKIVLEPFSSGQWKSAKMPLVSSELQQTKIPCVLWISFSRTTGEMNAQMQFVNLYVNQLNCDVTFHFDTAKKDESIGGHATILSARSSVCAAMFQGGMQETSTRKVYIKDIKPEIFKQLLHYIYSGRTSTELSEEIAQPLFVAADMYDVDDLKTECVRFLLSCIKLENAINLMAWAHVHSIDSLKEAVLDFVGSHGKEICKQDDWGRLIKNYPDLCLLATRRMWK